MNKRKTVKGKHCEEDRLRVRGMFLFELLWFLASFLKKAVVLEFKNTM